MTCPDPEDIEDDWKVVRPERLPPPEEAPSLTVEVESRPSQRRSLPENQTPIEACYAPNDVEIMRQITSSAVSKPALCMAITFRIVTDPVDTEIFDQTALDLSSMTRDGLIRLAVTMSVPPEELLNIQGRLRRRWELNPE